MEHRGIAEPTAKVKLSVGDSILPGLAEPAALICIYGPGAGEWLAGAEGSLRDIALATAHGFARGVAAAANWAARAGPFLVAVSLVACATAPRPEQRDLRACLTIAARSCLPELPFCRRDVTVACMADRGWEYVRGRGYLETQDALIAREAGQ